VALEKILSQQGLPQETLRIYCNICPSGVTLFANPAWWLLLQFIYPAHPGFSFANVLKVLTIVVTLFQRGVHCV